MTNDCTKGPDFSPLSWPNDYLMSRPEPEALSRALGLPVAKQYLAKLYCVSSDGPPTIHFGRKVRLPVAGFKQWLTDRMSPPRRSTSEVAYPLSDTFVVTDSRASVTRSHCHPPSPRSTKATTPLAESSKRSHRPPERKPRT